MSQTTVQQTSSIRMGSGVLKIDGVNVGALNAAKLDTKFSVLSIKADNAKLPAFKKIESATFSAELYEVYLPNLNKIDSFGVLTAAAGSSTPVVAEILKASGLFAANEIIFFANPNGAGTVVSSIVVKNDSTTLTLGTDYNIILQDGKTGIARIGTALTLTGIGLNVGYTYTPNASRTITYSDIAKLVGYYTVSFENTDANGKKFSITFPKGYSSADLTMEFKSDDKIDEAMTVPFEVIAFPNSSNVLFTIYDEQAAT